jgi:hypothetical protein
MTVSVVLGRGPLIRVFLNHRVRVSDPYSGTDVKIEIYTLADSGESATIVCSRTPKAAPRTMAVPAISFGFDITSLSLDPCGQLMLALASRWTIGRTVRHELVRAVCSAMSDSF